MTPRERTMAFALLGAIILGVGGVLGYMFVYSPLTEKWAQAEKLEGEISELDQKIGKIQADAPKIAQVKRQSLPPDINQAKTQYVLLLERLLQNAKITDYTLPDAKLIPQRAPFVPDLTPTPINAPGAPGAPGAPAGAPAQGASPPPSAGPPPPNAQKKFAYQQLQFEIKIKKADIWQIVDFLYGFYQLDLLHQITELSITRDNKPTDARNGLEVHIFCEALILDGAEPRTALFPVSTAVGAIGGNLAVEAVVRKLEVARKLTPVPNPPVLATRSRDYSLIPLRDMFYGPLPTEVKPPPFSLGKIDNVTIRNPEEPPAVKLKLTGDGSVGAKITATASGSLLPEGALTVDQKTLTITIPKVSEELGASATSTISVVAISVDGTKTQKGSFTVAMGQAPVEVPKLDIAQNIKLIIVSGTSEGTAKAVIKDAATPFRYEITATNKGIDILRFEWGDTSKVWRKDRDYEHPAGVLAFSDSYSMTKQTFKVIALEDNAVIVAHLTQPEPAKAEPKKFGARPGGGAGAAKPGAGHPLAAIIGNAAASVPPPEQVLYRWPLGKSLKEVTDPKGPCRLSADESKKVLKRVAIEGPIGPTALSSGQ